MFTDEDELFASLEADLMSEFSDPERIATMEHLNPLEVHKWMVEVFEELQQLGEVKAPCTERGEELHFLYNRLKHRQLEMMEPEEDE